MLNRVVLLFLLLIAGIVPAAEAAAPRIKKVLPHYLDKEGRHMLAPSLYERDAYQAHLRRHPEECRALRFDVNWKGGGATGPNLKLRLEARGAKGGLDKPVIVETPVKAPSIFSKWSVLTLKGDDYGNLGGLICWRVTLWDGETLLAEQKSFLW
jgi:hypothetical protein